MKQWLLGAVIGVVGGLGLGWAFFGGDAEDLDEFEGEAYVAEGSDSEEAEDEALSEAQAGGASEELEMDYDRCQQTLRQVSEAYEEALDRHSEDREMVEELEEIAERSGLTSPGGRAMDFPEQLDERFSAEEFPKVAESLMESCPDLFPEGTRTDCDEYPCAMIFESDELIRDVDFDEACPDMMESFAGSPITSTGFEVDDQYYAQVMPHGTGVGLQQHLDDHRGNLNRRLRHRSRQMHQGMATEKLEERCLFERDADACWSLAQAFGDDAEEQEVYLALACEEGHGRACYGYGHGRCVQRGQCDHMSQEMAQRAVELEPDNPDHHRVLGIIQCERGDQSRGQAALDQACGLGDSVACQWQC